MSGKIWLIVEDENDAEVVKILLRKRGILVPVISRPPAGGGHGISRLAKQLERLVADVKAQKEPNDCVAVLHDLDIHTQPDRRDYERITEICKLRKIKEIIACDELESWILADSGICQWLRMKPRNWDEKKKPKDKLKQVLRAKKLSYEGRDHAKVISHLNGDADQHSPSMREALAHLENAPCVRP